MRKIFIALLGLLLLAGQSHVVRAQEGGTAALSLVDAQEFPSVAALLDVFDAQGQPVIGLEPADVVMLENGQPYPVAGLTESTPPAQIVVAINPGPSLAVRDGEGIDRFSRVTEVLTGWAGAQPTDNPDDLSLVSIAGPIITHAEPDDWIVSLSSFQPDFRSTTPNVQSLAIALNTVNEPPPQPGMKRAILLITSRMDEPNIDLTLNTVAEQAIAAKVRVFVWFVEAEIYFDTPSATAFKALALQTGGEYFAFSGVETFPDLESYFAPLRHLYSLSYNSKLTTSGEQHTLAAQITTPAGEITSESRSFSVDVQPPNPILVMPPSQIVRQAPEGDPFNTELLMPDQQQLEIIVEFPDNHPRPLVRTTLYVDGVPAAQNDSEPFDRFVWDLSAYDESVEHKLVVEAVDSLGMSKASMSVPVLVTVVQAPEGPQAFLARYRTQFALGAVALAGGVLIVVLLSGRFRIKSRRERREKSIRSIDPVTQPVSIQQAEPKKRSQAASLPWVRANRLQDAPAYLTRLGSSGEPVTGQPIPLTEKETTLGTDPVQSLHVLDHPSVAALHAKISRTESAEFMLVDAGTVAGTWVNYDPIPKDGRIIKHGDVVHFGQLMYRFTLKKPPADAEPRIIPEVPSE